MAKIKEPDNSKFGEYAKQQELSCPAGEWVNWENRVGKRLDVLPAMISLLRITQQKKCMR